MTKRIMCAPDFFDVEYSINPWMDPSVDVDKVLAQSQWEYFVTTLKELGDEICFVPPVEGCLDMTFSGDAGIVVDQMFIPSNFRATERQPEVENYVRWFEASNYDIVNVPEGVYLEGLGDVVFDGMDAIIGHGIRSNLKALEFIKKTIPDMNIRCDLKIIDDRYFHLAMALSFLDKNTVLYYPGAFDAESVQALKRSIKNTIAVSEEDANRYFACNNLVIGDQVLIDGCTPQLESVLNKYGFQVRVCPMSEFKKSGGSLRCLVLSFMTTDEFNRKSVKSSHDTSYMAET